MRQPGLPGDGAGAVLSPEAPTGMARSPREGGRPGPPFPGSWYLLGFWLWDEKGSCVAGAGVSYSSHRALVSQLEMPVL